MVLVLCSGKVTSGIGHPRETDSGSMMKGVGVNAAKPTNGVGKPTPGAP